VEICRGSLYNTVSLLEAKQPILDLATQIQSQSGVIGVGINVDTAIYKGQYEDLEVLKLSTSLPVICNDFIVYAYQVFQAKSNGADAVKLMASVLPVQDLSYLIKITKAVGLTAIVVVSSKPQLMNLLTQVPEVEAISVTSRNMKLWKIQPGKAVGILDDPEVIENIQKKRLSKPEFVVIMEGFASNEEMVEARRLYASGQVDAVLLSEELLTGQDDISLKDKIKDWMG